MDLIDFSQDVFSNIVVEYSRVASQLNLNSVKYIPISALQGDNIVDRSDKMNWYEGETLLHFLENAQVEDGVEFGGARLPVQYVIRPQTPDLHDYRGYAGKIANGFYAKGDRVVIFPLGLETTIKTIEVGGVEVQEASAPQSVTLQLQDNIDVSRGDLIVKLQEQPEVLQEVDVLLTWMDAKPLRVGNKYLLQTNSRQVRSVVKEIEYKLDVNTLEKIDSPESVGLNDVVRAKIRTAAPVVVDKYSVSRATGSAILIDETSHSTVGAILIQ
jgi:sulfate adenylyltransferase subunit 1